MNFAFGFWLGFAQCLCASHSDIWFSYSHDAPHDLSLLRACVTSVRFNPRE